MSVELFESLKRQSEGLTPQEKSRLGIYLLEQAGEGDAKSKTPVHEEVAELKRKQHMEWLRANDEQFGGQYVALDGNRLVCTGRTFKEVAQMARAAGKPDAFVTYLPKRDEVLEAGGWM